MKKIALPIDRTHIEYAVTHCRWGALLVAQTKLGVCAVLLADNADALLAELKQTFKNSSLIENNAALQANIHAVYRVIENPRLPHQIHLDMHGTAFQQRVWQALREIPAGEKVSYSALAEKIGKPKAVRAVASACAANKIAVLIPCHRAVRNDGALSGYRWGVERKRAMLDLEAQK